MKRSASISSCGQYRYTLDREWDAAGTLCVFVMLNPSTADGEQDDPTIRKCIGFAQRWGHGRLRVVNLFAWRATDPKEIKKVNYPVGPENDAVIAAAIREANFVVAAYGAHGAYGGRNHQVCDIFRREGITTHAVKLTDEGHPYHPLYVSYEAEPFVFTGGKT